jgi:hypothetical protein
MDLHVPGGPVRSLKEFLIHLGIVTLGILIALGLGQLVELHHRSSIAAQAVASFQREIADNEAEVRGVLARMPELHKRIDGAIKQLSTMPTPGADEAPLIYPGISYNLVSTASWDTAIATQALNELPYDAVRRYTAAYGVLRLFVDEERTGLSSWQNLHRFGTDAKALSKEQRNAAIEELRRYESALVVIEFAGQGALKSCEEALK